MKNIKVYNTLTNTLIADFHSENGEYEIASIWGKPARDLPKKKDPLSQGNYDDSLVIGEFEKEVQPERTLGGVTYPAIVETWVHLKAEYNIVVTDVTEEHNLKIKLNSKISIGNKVEGLSQKLLNLIVGDNILKARDGAKRDKMKKDFEAIYIAISEGSLKDAKILIEELDITKHPEYKELQEDILAMYKLEGY